MKDKNILKRFISFEPYECNAIKEYLEEMATQGWRLKSYHFCFLFERMEPQNLKYAVDIFEKASDFDTKPEEKALEYLVYCKEAGWDFLCSKGMIHIFSSTDDDTIPIQTDAGLQYKVLKKMTYKRLGFSLFVFILSAFNICTSFGDFSWYITSNTYLFATIIYFGILFYIVWNLWLFYRWCAKTKENLAMDLGLSSITCEEVKRHHKINMIFLQFIFAILLTPIIIAGFMREKSNFLAGGSSILMIIFFMVVVGVTQRKKLAREVNIMVTFLEAFLITALWLGGIFWSVTNDDTPKEIPRFTMEEFGITQQGMVGEESTSKSLLAEETTGDFIPKKDTEEEQSYVFYTIFKSRIPWVMEHYLQYMLEKDLGRGNSYELVEENAWGTEQVYRSSKWAVKTMVVYPDCIFTYETDAPLTEENINGVIGKLQLKQD